jgi:hypothetical protein
MQINQISRSEFFITKQSVIGFLNGKADSMGGVCKAKDFHSQKMPLNVATRPKVKPNGVDYSFSKIEQPSTSSDIFLGRD